MKSQIHLILDPNSYFISLFWQRHGLTIMEQLVPTEFSIISPKISFAQQIGTSLRYGNINRFIILGSPATMFHAFNTLMKIPEDRRKMTDVGFWPLTAGEVARSLLQTSNYLLPLLHTFKSGQSIPVSVAETRYGEEEEEILYFWNDLLVYSEGKTSPSTLSVENEEDCIYETEVRYRIQLHRELLDSWKVNHSRLVKTTHLQAYVSTHRKRFRDYRSLMKTEFWVQKGDTLQIRGNYLRLHSIFTGKIASTQKVDIRMIRRAFNLLLPMIPVRSKETVRSNLLILKPKKFAATGRESNPQNFRKIKEPKSLNMIVDNRSQS